MSLEKDIMIQWLIRYCVSNHSKMTSFEVNLNLTFIYNQIKEIENIMRGFKRCLSFTSDGFFEYCLDKDKLFLISIE